jgi:hypothetical protein
MNIFEMHRAFKLELDKTSALELPSFEPEEIDFWLNNGIHRFVKTRYSEFEQTTKRSEDLKTLVVEESITYTSGDLTSGEVKPNSYLADITSLTNIKWFTLGEEVTIQYHDIRTPSSHSTKRQGITQCTTDTYRSHIDDPYSEHRLHYEEAKPLRLNYQTSVELVTDGNYEVTSYHIRYLKKPVRVNILTTVYTTSTSNIQSGLTYIVSTDNIVYNNVTYHSATSDIFTGFDSPTTFTGGGTATTQVANCDLPEHTHEEIVKLAVSMALENIEQPRYQSYQNEVK